MIGTLFIALFWSPGAPAQTCAPLPKGYVRSFRSAVGATVDGISVIVRKEAEGEFSVAGDKALAVHRLMTASLKKADGEGAAERLESCLKSSAQDGSCLSPLNDYLRAGYGLSNVLTHALDCGEIEEASVATMREACADIELQLKDVVDQTMKALGVNAASTRADKSEALCAALKVRIQFERNQRAVRDLLGSVDVADAPVLERMEELANGICAQ